MTENDPQEGPKIDPKTTQNRYQNRLKFRCENQEGLTRIGPQTLGASPPPGGAPGALGRGAKRQGTGPQAPMCAVKNQKNYTIIQVYKVYSIHYTVYSVHGYSIQCVKGTVYSIQGTRV